MKEHTSHTSKIINLIEALSMLTGEDLEEAREVLKAAGKDPDALLKRSIEKLERIRRTASETHTGIRFIFFDPDNKSILLQDRWHTGYNMLTADQIYNTLIQKQPLNSIPYSDLIISSQVRQLKFHHALRELQFLIRMQIRDASVQPMLVRKQEVKPLPLKGIGTILTAGYVIIQNSCYALEKEWLPGAKQFALTLKEESRISLGQAMGYFGNKNDLPFLRFEPEQLDLQKILQSPEFSGRTSLFVKELYAYQQNGLKWLQYCCLNRVGGILGDDMGLGKTAQAIALIAWCIEYNIFEHILIVAPGTLLENWRREFGTFAPSVIPYIHHGSLRAGAVSVLQQQRVVITSYSLVINDVYLLDKIPWGVLFLDEASLIRNPESERRIALKQLPAEVRICMTGTPLENSLTDLWSLTDFVRPGYLGSRKEFAAGFLRKDIASTLAGTNLAWLRTAISYIMLRRKKEDVLDSLPERTDIHQAVEMSEPEALQYEEIRTKALEELSTTKSRTHVLSHIQELRQFATHPWLKNKNQIESSSLTDLMNSSIKFSRTIELLDEIHLNKEKVLIFTEYLQMIDVMRKELGVYYKAPVFQLDGRMKMAQRQPAIDAFSNTAGFSIMILNPKVAGMGLNITAANHVIHYTRQWNPALEEQATARVYRNGQRKGVNIYYLYYADSIEETIDNRLRAKRALSGEVIQETDTSGSIEECLEAISKSPIK